MALNTNTKKYIDYYKWVDENHGPMSLASIPAPNSGVYPDLWYVDENDPTQGLTGMDPAITPVEKPENRSPKKFLGMKPWTAVLVAVGIAGAAFGIYKIVTRKKSK